MQLVLCIICVSKRVNASIVITISMSEEIIAFYWLLLYPVLKVNFGASKSVTNSYEVALSSGVFYSEAPSVTSKTRLTLLRLPKSVPRACSNSSFI